MIDKSFFQILAVLLGLMAISFYCGYNTKFSSDRYFVSYVYTLEKGNGIGWVDITTDIKTSKDIERVQNEVKKLHPEILTITTTNFIKF